MNERDTVELMSTLESSFDGSSISFSLVSASGAFLTRRMIEKEVKELLDDAFPDYNPEDLDS